jgi:hypothetical protein
MRGRIGVIAGAIDKVGIIPLAAGWLFSWSKFLQDAHVQSTSVDTYVAGLGVLYFLSIVMIATSYRLDDLAQVTEFAALATPNSSYSSQGLSCPSDENLA